MGFSEYRKETNKKNSQTQNKQSAQNTKSGFAQYRAEQKNAAPIKNDTIVNPPALNKISQSLGNAVNFVVGGAYSAKPSNNIIEDNPAIGAAKAAISWGDYEGAYNALSPLVGVDGYTEKHVVNTYNKLVSDAKNAITPQTRLKVLEGIKNRAFDQAEKANAEYDELLYKHSNMEDIDGYNRDAAEKEAIAKKESAVKVLGDAERLYKNYEIDLASQNAKDKASQAQNEVTRAHNADVFKIDEAIAGFKEETAALKDAEAKALERAGTLYASVDQTSADAYSQNQAYLEAQNEAWAASNAVKNNEAQIFYAEGLKTFAALPENDRNLLLNYVKGEKDKEGFKRIKSSVNKDEFERMYETLCALENKVKSAENEVKTVRFAAEFPVTASVASVFSSLVGGASAVVGTIAHGIDNIGKEKGFVAPIDVNSLAFAATKHANVTRGTVASGIEEDIGGVGGKVASFLYQTGMSAVDSLAASLTGNLGGALLLGTGAASNAFLDAKERGISDSRAIATAVLSGTFETLFERVSLGNFEKLKDVKPESIKAVLGNIAKSALVNASEEGLTEAANMISDALINGDLSKYSVMYDELIASNMSAEEAKNKVMWTMLGDLGLATAGGAVMGVGMGAAGNVVGYVSGIENVRSSISQKAQGAFDVAIDGAKDKGAAATQFKIKYLEGVTGEDFAADAESELTSAMQEAAYKYGAEAANDYVAETIKSLANEDSESLFTPTRASNVEAKSYNTQAGTIYVEDGAAVTSDLVKLSKSVAKDLNVPISIVKTLGGTRGYYITDSGEIVVASDAVVKVKDKSGNFTVLKGTEAAQRIILGHELTHRLKAAGGDAFTRFEQFVRTQFPNVDNTVAKYMKRLELDETAAFEELVSDYAMANLFADEKLAKEVTKKQPKIAQIIRDFFEWVKTKLGIKGKELSNIEYAARLWNDAYNESVKASKRGTETKNTTEGGVKYSFGGENAKTADVSNLEEAKRMDREGADSESIRKATGWHKGYDGRWRFEIDDSKLQLFKNGDALFSQNHPEYVELQNLYNKLFAGDMTAEEQKRLAELDEVWGREHARLAQRVDSGNATLENIIQHDELFKAYPELRNVKVVFEGMESGTNGSYDRNTKTIKLGEHLLKNEFKLKKTLLHEIEHAVQHIEGFAEGSDPTSWELKKKNDLEESKKAYDDSLKMILSFDDGNHLDKWREYNRGEIELSELLAEESYTQEEKELFLKHIQNSQRYLALRNDSRSGELLYEKTAGEIEARDVSARSDLDAEQRKNTRPDIDRTDVVFADGVGENYDVAIDNNLNKVAVITENILDGVKTQAHKVVAQNIIQHIGEYYRIFESGQKVYIGVDLPGEYTQSEYTKNLFKHHRDKILKAKNLASQNIGEMIEIATDRRWEKNQKSKHAIDAKYGWYKYTTRFAIPVRDANKNVVNFIVYKAELVIRNDADGKKYLYDIQDIKTETSSKLPTSWISKLNNNSSMSLENNVPQNTPSVNTQYMQNSQNNVSTDKKSVAGTEELLFASEAEKAQYVADSFNLSGVENYKAAGSMERISGIVTDIAKTNRVKMDNRAQLANAIAKGVQNMRKAAKSDDAKIKQTAAEGFIEAARIVAPSADAKAEVNIANALAESIWAEMTTDTSAAEVRNIRNEAIKTAKAEVRESRLANSQTLVHEMYYGRQYAEKIGKKDRELKAFREKSDKKLKDLNEKFRQKEYDRRAKENERYHREHAEQKAKELYEWVVSPDKKGHSVPESVRLQIGELLASLNFKKGKPNRYGEITAHDARWQDRMKILATSLENVSKHAGETNTDGSVNAYVPEGIIDMIKAFANAEGNANVKNVYSMSKEQIQDLDEILTVIHHHIRLANKVMVEGKQQNIADIGNKVIRELSSAKQKRSPKLGYDLMDATTYTDYVGGTFGKVVKSLRKSFDKFIDGVAAVEEFTQSNFETKDVKEWRNNVNTFTIDGVKVDMTTTQLMSLYCLSKREQGLKHILGGGIKIDSAPVLDAKNPISTEGKRAKSNESKSISVTQSDLDAMFERLTAEQKEAANKIQDYMNTVLAGMGNEASRAMYGVNLFTEANYFPIRVDKNALNSNANDKNNTESLHAIANSGMTKKTEKYARNTVEISDIFSVFTQHSSDMLNYYAYAETIEDAIKVFDYRNTDGKYLKQELADKYSEAGVNYFKNLVKALNGQRAFASTETDKALKKLAGNAKAAMVGANARVVLQQPTAILRAYAVMDAKYLVKSGKPVSLEKVKKYCPIARWKSWGFYDTDIGQSLDSILFGNTNVWDAVRDKQMWAAGKADEVTWGLLWNACEAEIKDKRRDLTVGSEEFNRAVGERLSEVIDETQVVDSPFHKVQMARGGDAAKTVTSFQSEPLKSYNLLFRAAFVKKNAKAVARSLVAVELANTFAAIFAALADAWRDDDDELGYWEKFFNHAKDNALENLDIINLVPFAGDASKIIRALGAKLIDSMFGTDLASKVPEVYDSTRYDMAVLGEAADFINNPSIYKAARMISYGSGIAFSNVYRDISGVVHTLANGVSPKGAYKKSLALGDENTIKKNYDAFLDAKCDELAQKRAGVLFKSLTETQQKEIKKDAASSIKQTTRNLFKDKYIDAWLKMDYEEIQHIKLALAATDLYSSKDIANMFDSFKKQYYKEKYQNAKDKDKVVSEAVAKVLFKNKSEALKYFIG